MHTSLRIRAVEDSIHHQEQSIAKLDELYRATGFLSSIGDMIEDMHNVLRRQRVLLASLQEVA